MRDIIKSIELVLGGIVLSIGLGIVSIHAARQHFFGVFTGFVLFIAGYELSRYSAYTSDTSKTQEFIVEIVDHSRPADALMVIIGMGVLMYGVTLLFESMQNPSFLLAALSAAMVFGGYIMMHFAINKTVI